MVQITPVLLCGGFGTRVWPLSRKACPRQFTLLTGSRTLFQATLARFAGPGWDTPMIVTAGAYLGLVQEQAEAAGLALGCILVEPLARGTAPCILAAALELARSDADALMLVSPSDHAIPDGGAFRETVLAGVEVAQAGQIVTIGIRPTRPETRYSWLELTEVPQDASPRPLALRRFVEKPSPPQAEAMFTTGRYLWNPGIYLTTARTMIYAFATHAPALIAPVRTALSDVLTEPDVCHLAAVPWAQAADISVDFAVMERATNVSVVPFSDGWSDLGD